MEITPVTTDDVLKAQADYKDCHEAWEQVTVDYNDSHWRLLKAQTNLLEAQGENMEARFIMDDAHADSIKAQASLAAVIEAYEISRAAAAEENA